MAASVRQHFDLELKLVAELSEHYSPQTQSMTCRSNVYNCATFFNDNKNCHKQKCRNCTG